MKPTYAASFERDYRRLPPAIQSAVDNQLQLFFENPRHPSINLKKMQGFRNIWRGKITGGYRFTVQIDGASCVFRRVGPHDVLNDP